MPRWTLAVGALLALAALVCAARRPPAAAELAVRAIGGDPAVVGARAQASLPLALAEAGLLWMATRRRARSRSAAPAAERRRRAAAADRRPDRGQPPDRPVLSRGRGLRADGVRAAHRAKKDPGGRVPDAGRGVLPGDLAALGGRRGLDARCTRTRAAGRGRSYTPVLWGRGTVINEDFDAGDLSRVESLRRVSGFATGFQRLGGVLRQPRAAAGASVTRTSGPIAGYRRFGGDAPPGLGRARARLSRHPAARALERGAGRGGGAPGGAAPGATGRSSLESGGAAAGSARPGSVRVVEKTAERLVLDVDAADADLALRPAGASGRTAGSARRPARRGRPRAAGVHRRAGSGGQAPPDVGGAACPGSASRCWGPSLFGMIAIGSLLPAPDGHRRTA